MRLQIPMEKYAPENICFVLIILVKAGKKEI